MRSDFIFLFLMKRNRTFNLNINRKDSDTTDELKIIHKIFSYMNSNSLLNYILTAVNKDDLNLLMQIYI